MNENVLKLGISPCPNDTFAFYHLIKEKGALPFKTEIVVEDVETLNRMMLAGELDVTKVSFHALGQALDRYMLLRAGSALGRGCGPLLLSKEYMEPEKIKECSVAIPGDYTTATLLLRLYEPGVRNLVPMNFSDIPKAVQEGRVDAGLVIHEIRFTYRKFSLVSLQDLGQWWEKETGLPIPLGGIAARRNLPGEWLYELNRHLVASIDYAWGHFEEITPFMQKYAADMSPDVMERHVNLYVNAFTRDLGREGELAINFLFQKGSECGIFHSGSSGRAFVLEQK